VNKETGKRLFEYRKANGYSQEDLAEKIGVSRQAISKWERAESSPDTENLIALAKLYNITIDELINGKEETQETERTEDDVKYDNIDTETEVEENTQPDVSFRNGIHVHDGKDTVDISFSGIHVETKNGESVHIGGHGIQVDGIDESYVGKRKPNPLHALLPIGVIIAYLIIGFTFERGWALGWLLVFIIPIVESIITAARTKKPSLFAYPILVTAIYLTIGMFIGLWHPTWILFLTIPIYYVIADAFKQKKKENDSQ